MMECNTNLNNYKIILGSHSPRRKELLEKTGLKFIVKATDVKEDFKAFINIEEAAKAMAKLKANSFNDLKNNEILICADTLVSVGRKILGKPKSEKEAEEMLRLLSGKVYKVTTGVAIKSNKNQKIFF